MNYEDRFIGALFGQAIGDAFTNAAMVGAKFGLSNIPKQWINDLTGGNVICIKVSHSETMLEIVDQYKTSPFRGLLLISFKISQLLHNPN